MIELSLIACGLALAAVIVDRLLVACELRGWITYRLTPRARHGFRGAAGNALLNLDVFFHPQGRHYVEMRSEQELLREDDDEAGAGEPRGAIPPGAP